ncbi:MAG TPA: LrgB family protein [Candidatus Didemnitutus sp.]|nr:LrgB family protein [Candidatus Didemnitutus sp.]
MIPFAWTFITLAVFFSARWIYLRAKSPLLHPVMWASVTLIVVMEALGHGHYALYREQTTGMFWFLGPAVVALAVPIYRLRAIILRHARGLVIVVIASLAFSLASTAGVLLLFGLTRTVIEALCLKSVTAVVAFAIAQEIHAEPLLAGVATMVAGMLGAIGGPWIVRRLGIRDPRAAGLAIGCGSHVLGTMRAFEESEEMGTFASVAMALTALGAALICPPLFLLFS